MTGTSSLFARDEKIFEVIITIMTDPNASSTSHGLASLSRWS